MLLVSKDPESTASRDDQPCVRPIQQRDPLTAFILYSTPASLYCVGTHWQQFANCVILAKSLFRLDHIPQQFIAQIQLVRQYGHYIPSCVLVDFYTFLVKSKVTPKQLLGWAGIKAKEAYLSRSSVMAPQVHRAIQQMKREWLQNPTAQPLELFAGRLYHCLYENMFSLVNDDVITGVKLDPCSPGFPLFYSPASSTCQLPNLDAFLGLQVKLNSLNERPLLWKSIRKQAYASFFHSMGRILHRLLSRYGPCCRLFSSSTLCETCAPLECKFLIQECKLDDRILYIWIKLSPGVVSLNWNPLQQTPDPNKDTFVEFVI